MGFLSRLIGAEVKHHKMVVRSPGLMQCVEEGGISYDARLLDRLKEDHKELVRLFNSIKIASHEGHFSQLPLLLSNLRLAFQTHVMLENVKFYVYVQQHFPLNSETSVFISDVRSEMDDIARMLMRFVKRYSSIRLAQDTVADFNAELDQIGAVLMQRVQLEEHRLYALYLPRYTTDDPASIM